MLVSCRKQNPVSDKIWEETLVTFEREFHQERNKVGFFKDLLQIIQSDPKNGTPPTFQLDPSHSAARIVIIVRQLLY